jgi:four helix bundle protein
MSVYNLETRTSEFARQIILLARQVPLDHITRPIITQFVKSGTSVAANYCEADDAESARDFVHKLGIAKKEAQETRHWLNMLQVTTPSLKAAAQELEREANEINLILNAIIRKIRAKKS